MGRGFGNMVVTKNCKYPERVMALINYLHSDEGMLLHHWGVEGTHYTIDENGVRDATPELIAMYGTDDYKNIGFGCFINLGCAYEQALNPKDGQPGAITYSAGIQSVNYTDRQLEACEKTYGAPLPWDVFAEGYSRRTFQEITDPGVNGACESVYTDDDMMDLKDALLEYTYEAIPKIIMAESVEAFEAEFNATVAARQDMGIENVIAAMQTAVDAIEVAE